MSVLYWVHCYQILELNNNFIYMFQHIWCCSVKNDLFIDNRIVNYKTGEKLPV